MNKYFFQIKSISQFKPATNSKNFKRCILCINKYTPTYQLFPYLFHIQLVYHSKK